MAQGLCLGVEKIKLKEPIKMAICESHESRKWNFLVE